MSAARQEQHAVAALAQATIREAEAVAEAAERVSRMAHAYTINVRVADAAAVTAERARRLVEALREQQAGGAR